MEKQPMFKVGDRVIRIVENLAATVIEVKSPDTEEYEFSYLLLYDEGATLGNDGTGWWLEGSLQLE